MVIFGLHRQLHWRFHVGTAGIKADVRRRKKFQRGGNIFAVEPLSL